MAKISVMQMPDFKRAYKKLHKKQKQAVDDAIAEITENPQLGVPKKGDLAGVFVYKFQSVKQEYLLAYEFDKLSRLLLALGLHENFYRDLKRKR
jgi:mRNA interferase RelE/StbE